jgi:hypothetical protein
MMDNGIGHVLPLNCDVPESLTPPLHQYYFLHPETINLDIASQRHKAAAGKA